MKRAEAILRLMKADKHRKDTQTAQVLEYLLTHKNGITNMDAFEKFKATRLSAIILELRRRHGITIITIDEKTAEGKPYGRYILVDEEESA